MGIQIYLSINTLTMKIIVEKNKPAFLLVLNEFQARNPIVGG